MVRMDLSPFVLHLPHGLDGVPGDQVVFAHSSGSVSVLEKTTLDMPGQLIGPGFALRRRSRDMSR